jgi:hypothetical protein
LVQDYQFFFADYLDIRVVEICRGWLLDRTWTDPLAAVEMASDSQNETLYP